METKETTSNPAEKKVKIFTVLSILLLIAAFFSPIWWVSLTAPNYPKDAFPDGIKINFFFTGVKNGCKIVEGVRSQEIFQGDLGDPSEEQAHHAAGKHSGLDCVHEMDTINHYVGMFPIVTGAPLEQAYSKYLFAIMIVMLFGFACRNKKIKVLIFGAGFVLISGWLVYSELFTGGITSLVANYQDSLGTYFKDAERIQNMSQTLSTYATATVYSLLALMLIVLIISIVAPKLINYIPLVIAFIPFYFIADFGGWLWYFGHNLHPWGAFTLKPFMPTVFGEGKVAQFSTFSYPSYGFFFLLVVMVLLLLAFLLRQKSLRVENGKQ